MTSLKENEWNQINEILLEVYSMDNEQEIAERFLKMSRILIPYTQAFFIMCDEDNQIISENCCFINISEQRKKSYIEHFYKLDYINYIIGDVRTIVFKDTDILENDLREKTEFYQEFLKPQNMQYGAGIVFIKEEKLLGIVNLFRAEELGDFTEKDLKILHLVKDHLANIIHSLRKNSKSLDGRVSINSEDISRYNLSKREMEIIQLMIDGKSNQDIGDALVISLSTVKKHVYNIFTKLGINSRMQMLKIFGKD
jgi:DNA-binding CsgD family transcriptional regulator